MTSERVSPSTSASGTSPTTGPTTEPNTSPAPLPELEPLQLLYVTNGSPLTADRWWLAHRYYQHRQNFHYQSLHQPGIVHGLGVRVVDGPDQIPSELRDRRWIEIQPGLAIDVVGNPIVLAQPIAFRITAKAIGQPVTAYVVLAYVNPREKQWAGPPADVVKEEFRISERTTPPEPHEIELCRVVVHDNMAPLQDAPIVMQPLAHQLDLRCRPQVQVRSPQPVKVGLIASSPGSLYQARLNGLLRSVEGLYPALSGVSTVFELRPDQLVQQAALLRDTSVLFLPYDLAIALSDTEVEQLQRYVSGGGTLLIEFSQPSSGQRPLEQPPLEQPRELSDPTQSSAQPDNRSSLQLGELLTVKTELLSALKDLESAKPGTELEQIRHDLTVEFNQCEAAFQARLRQIALPLQVFTHRQAGIGVQSLEPALTAPLPTQHPFEFDELPQLPTGPVQLLAWDGVVLIIGPLSAGWTARQFDEPLARETIRSAQELGINLLYQASKRWKMMQAQCSSPLGANTPGVNTLGANTLSASTLNASVESKGIESNSIESESEYMPTAQVSETSMTTDSMTTDAMTTDSVATDSISSGSTLKEVYS